MEIIYVVYEIGEGSIHVAFKDKSKAEAYLADISAQTEMDCYEIISVGYDAD